MKLKLRDVIMIQNAKGKRESERKGIIEEIKLYV